MFFFLRFFQKIFLPPLLNHLPATPQGLAASLCHAPNQLGAHGEFYYNISMKFAVNWFRNVNLALCSNLIIPDHCVAHGCSNRSDMNASITAHFSATIKSEREKWLRFVHIHRANFNPSGGCVQSISRRMFFKSVSYGRLSSSAYSWLNSYNMED